MSGPYRQLDANGKVQLDSGGKQILAGDGDPCCCAASFPCGILASVPRTFTLSPSEIAIIRAEQRYTINGYDLITQAQTWNSGTFVLTQVESCHWQLLVTAAGAGISIFLFEGDNTGSPSGPVVTASVLFDVWYQVISGVTVQTITAQICFSIATLFLAHYPLFNFDSGAIVGPITPTPETINNGFSALPTPTGPGTYNTSWGYSDGLGTFPLPTSGLFSSTGWGGTFDVTPNF